MLDPVPAHLSILHLTCPCRLQSHHRSARRMQKTVLCPESKNFESIVQLGSFYYSPSNRESLLLADILFEETTSSANEFAVQVWIPCFEFFMSFPGLSLAEFCSCWFSQLSRGGLLD